MGCSSTAIMDTKRDLPMVKRLAWTPVSTNLAPQRDPEFTKGGHSGFWLSDLQYHNGRWLLGDGLGGLWHSVDGLAWERGQTRANSRPRSMQNAPVRSLNPSANGTVVATFLSGGGLSDKTESDKVAGMRAPVARTTDGVHWEVHTVPKSCGAHFAATNGNGTWVIPMCAIGFVRLSADDGKTWEVHNTGVPARFEALGYLNGVWVAGTARVQAEAGSSLRGIYYSYDLSTWTKALSIPVHAKRTLVLNGHLVMTGGNGYLATSPDGVHWTQRRPSARGQPVMQAGIHHPEYGYIVGGEQCAIMYSTDLVTWTYGYLGATPCAGELTGLAVSPDGQVLATTSAGPGLDVWRLKVGNEGLTDP